jgi:hypothetical protein
MNTTLLRPMNLLLIIVIVLATQAVFSKVKTYLSSSPAGSQ